MLTFYIQSQMPLPADKRKYSLKRFKLALIHQLADHFSSRKRSSSSSGLHILSVVSRDILPGHSLVHLNGRKKACRACIMKARRTPSGRCVETSYACSLCQVYLCRKGACFHEFHGLLYMYLNCYCCAFEFFSNTCTVLSTSKIQKPD